MKENIISEKLIRSLLLQMSEHQLIKIKSEISSMLKKRRQSLETFKLNF